MWKHTDTNIDAQLINAKAAVRLVESEIRQVEGDVFTNDIELFRLKRRRAELEATYQKLRTLATPDIIA